MSGTARSDVIIAAGQSIGDLAAYKLTPIDLPSADRIPDRTPDPKFWPFDADSLSTTSRCKIRHHISRIRGG